MPRLRQVIAQRMTESLRVSAQLTTVQEVDVTRIARLRAQAKAEFERREGVKLTYLPFFAKATVEALKQYPQLNASINEESKEVTYHGAVHLAIAVDTPRGLLVPVITNADEPEHRRPRPAHRRPRRAHPRQQGRPERAVRRHLHDHQHRQLGRPVRHADHQPAAGRDPGHRRHQQGA